MVKNILTQPRALLMSAVILASMLISSLSLSRPAAAACAVPATNYGTATMKLTVATAGNYRIWTQMNVPNTTNNAYLLEIDSGTCYTVGDGGQSANTWTWVDYQKGVKSSKITANLSAGTHTIKVVGHEPSVKIGRILAAADQNCIPSGVGTNCMATADTTKPVTAITMPENLSTVSGNLAVKATATDNVKVTKVEFFVQNVLKSTSTTAPYQYNWDTTTVADGSYTLLVKAHDAAGNVSFDTRSVTVKNNVVKAPSAPVNISAKANSATEVGLSWQAGTGATADLRYRIIRNNVAVATVTGLSYTDKTVAANTTYSYYVTAVNSANMTSTLPSSATRVTTPALPVKDTQAPTAPSNLKASTVSTTQINLTWTASTDNSGVKHYDVYRYLTNAQPTKVATVTGTSYGDGGLTAGTAYSYSVVAVDTSDNRSTASTRQSATTQAKPPVAQQLGSIRGTVKSKSGRPISGAKAVVWVGDKRYRATTNWRGQYTIKYVPAGWYEVKIKARSYDTQRYDIKVNAGKTKWIDATLRR